MTTPPSEERNAPAHRPDPESPHAAARTSEEVANASPLARFFFLKTTFGLLFTAVLLIGGLFAYGLLTKEALPDLDIARATISTSWGGADARSIEEQVTDRIEDEVTTIAGVRSVNSASFDSFSVIAVEFEPGSDSSDAMMRLRAAVSEAEGELPDMADKPVITQVSVDDRPILTLALHGGDDARARGAYARQIRDRLERIPGVDEAQLGGEREEVVQILILPERLLALGLQASTVRDTIQQANLEQPFGDIRSSSLAATVRLEGRFRSLDDLRALPVARIETGGGQRAVRLDEIATVRRTLEEETSRVFYGSGSDAYQAALEISITKTPGADTIEVIEAIFASLDEMHGGEDHEFTLTVVQDGAADIWESLGEVFFSGLQSMLIVFVILFVVIAWREALITGLAIPVTFAGVLLCLLLFGQTLNELVIIGMVVALVLIIDVFIIMLEGLHDEIYVQRATFGQAVLRTVRRYGKPAFAAQITTILALLPLMMIGGDAGAFIRILPITTITCLAIAFALTLLAAMPLSRFLLGKAGASGADKQSKADQITQSAMSWLEAWSTRHVLSSRTRAWQWIGGSALLLLVSILAFSQTRIDLFPMTDAPQLGINIELPPTEPLDASQAVADAVGEILRGKDYLDSTIMLVGRKSPFTQQSAAGQLQPDEAENYVGFSSIFKPREARDAHSFELAEELRAEIEDYLSEHVAGATLEVVPEHASPTPGSPVEIDITGPDMTTLQQLSRQVQDALIANGGVVDVRDNIGALSPQINYQPDREAASLFGVTAGELASQVRIAFSSDEIGDFATGSEEDDIEIRLGIAWPSQGGDAGGPQDRSELALVRVQNSQGDSIPLSELVQQSSSEGAISISHVAGERTVTVMARNQGRTVSEIVESLTPVLDEMQAQWPDQYRYVIGGEAADTGETFGSAGIALVVAVLLVIGVLVIMFDSFAQSMIIVATMPLAIIGALLGFFLFGLSFSFFAMIGLISLIGIVVNTGIIMVDTMNQSLRDGASVAEAAAAGAARRLRPVLTTSITTIIGLAPLAISSDMYRPLTLVIIFGLISATVLSLIVVPALYLLLTKDEDGQEQALD